MTRQNGDGCIQPCSTVFCGRTFQSLCYANARGPPLLGAVLAHQLPGAGGVAPSGKAAPGRAVRPRLWGRRVIFSRADETGRDLKGKCFRSQIQKVQNWN